MAYSYVQYVGNASTVTFSVPFSYISKEHVEVRVNNVLKTVGTDYTWSSSSAVTFVTAPATGLTVDIRRRSSPTTRLVDFQDGSTLTQDILDADSNQNFFLAQESFDAVDQRLPLATDGQWDANSRRIKNVADPVNAQDAATKNWAENSATSFIVAAQSQATAASASATAAANSATSAASSATSATSSANSASTSATNAASSASTATTKASEASTSATNAATSATNAANSATTAQGYLASVQTNATNAATSATAAAASATNAAASASAAASSATNANSSAVNAASSESNANASKLAAAGSATSAANSASSAAASATTATTAKNDALAIYGSISAVNAAVTSAQTSATNSATSAGQAATSATNAANSATAAANSATSAASSSVSAATSATNAAALYGSASALNTAVNSAQNSATNAGTSAAQASGYVSTVATSATNAANSATQAAASAASAAAIVTNVSSNRPSVRPSLLLDFQYTKQLDPRITFSRPTTATYYDGKTVVKAEENLLTYSQEFDNASWTKQSVTVTANATTAPDGTSTAETLTATAAASTHFLGQDKSATVPAATTFTYSIYAKAGTHNYITIVASTGFSTQWFAATADLSTGTITKTGAGVSGTYTSSSITNVGGGWYRIAVTGQVTTSGFYVWNYLNQTNNPTYGGYGAESWTAAGTETVYVWGAQVEQRSTVTAYTPTTTAPITNYIPALQTAVSNDARFDHDPVTGESKGLLIEEQRTNLLTYSEQFDNAAWTKTRSSITSNVVVAPDGTLSGDKLIEDTTASNNHLVQQSISVVSGTAYTLTVYSKAAERAYIQLVLNGQFSTAIAAIFSLSDGSVGTTAGSPTTSVAYVGNGWYRFSITSTATATGTTAATVRVTNSSTTAIYTGDGTSGLYIWGAQLEAGSFPTSYIPTVASQVTRSADSASMTGSNFSSWYRQDEGSLYVETLANNYATTGAQIRTFAMVSNDAETTYNYFGRGATVAIRFTPVINGVTQTQTPASASAFGSITVGQADKFVFGYSSSIPSLVLNGTKATDNTSPYIQPRELTTLRIGGVLGGSSLYTLNGTIKRIAYYPKRLSNTELQGLTS